MPFIEPEAVLKKHKSSEKTQLLPSGLVQFGLYCLNTVVMYNILGLALEVTGTYSLEIRKLPLSFAIMKEKNLYFVCV